MRCKKVRDLISAYLDEMTDEKESVLVEAHLSVCKPCLDLAHKMREIRHAMMSLDCPLPPPGFADDLQRRLQEEKQRPDKPWPRVSRQVRALLSKETAGRVKGELIRFYHWRKKTLG